jgi:hypothetical protein
MAKRERRFLSGSRLRRIGNDLVDCLAHQLIGCHTLLVRQGDELGLLLWLQGQSDGHAAGPFHDYALIMYANATPAANH